MTEDDPASVSWWVKAQAAGKREDFYQALAARRLEQQQRKPGPAADVPWPWSKRTVARATAIVEGHR